jgi:hypothetical protein
MPSPIPLWFLLILCQDPPTFLLECQHLPGLILGSEPVSIPRGFLCKHKHVPAHPFGCISVLLLPILTFCGTLSPVHLAK